MSLFFAWRMSAIIEGISYLLLLFVAMPMKYMYGMPEAVSIVGSAHGLLFVVFIHFCLIIFFLPFFLSVFPHFFLAFFLSFFLLLLQFF